MAISDKVCALLITNLETRCSALAGAGRGVVGRTLHAFPGGDPGIDTSHDRNDENTDYGYSAPFQSGKKHGLILHRYAILTERPAGRHLKRALALLEEYDFGAGILHFCSEMFSEPFECFQTIETDVCVIVFIVPVMKGFGSRKPRSHDAHPSTRLQASPEPLHFAQRLMQVFDHFARRDEIILPSEYLQVRSVKAVIEANLVSGFFEHD